MPRQVTGSELSLEQVEALLDRVSFAAEALGTEVVGEPALGHPPGHLAHVVADRRGNAAGMDREPVGCQVTGLQLVLVPGHLEDTDRLGVDPLDTRFGFGRNRNPLPGDRPAIFHPGGADVTLRDLQAAGQVSQESLGGDIPFLDPQKQMLSLPGKSVSGNLLDKEILGVALQHGLD